VKNGLPRVHDLAPMEPPVVVVGDVHASSAHPEIEARFLAYLKSLEGRGGTVVLLGDVFDWWVGRGQQGEPESRPVLDALRGLVASGVRLCFQAGNRDFAFDGADGLALDLWPDVVRTTWGARRVLLTHGDLLVSGDTSYLAMRRVLRSRLFTWGRKRLLPYRLLRGIAQALRRTTSRALRRKDRRWLDIDYGLARQWLSAADADVLVAGHVHTGVHHRLPAERPLDVLVLKDWDHRGGVVSWDGRTIALVPV
jgi:UDP-2,3-diacylglucosamine hydrolase